MPKTMIVAVREFRQRIRARGFWLGSIGVPLVFLVIWIFAGGAGNTSPAAEMNLPKQTIGYVDQAA